MENTKHIVAIMDSIQMLETYAKSVEAGTDVRPTLIYADIPYSPNAELQHDFKYAPETEAAARAEEAEIAAINAPFGLVTDKFVKKSQTNWTWQSGVHEAWIDAIDRECAGAANFLNEYRKQAGDKAVAQMIWLAIRLVYCKRILSDDGSIYIHCDDAANHQIRSVMDLVFGARNYRNSIAWRRHDNNNSGGNYGRITDTILYYAKDKKRRIWNQQYLPYDETQIAKLQKDADGRAFRSLPLCGFGKDPDKMQPWRGMTPTSNWIHTLETREKLWAEGRIITSKAGNHRRIAYMDEMPGMLPQNIWTDINRVHTGNIAGGTSKLRLDGTGTVKTAMEGPRVRYGESGQPWRGYDPSLKGCHWSPPRSGAVAQWIETVLPGYKDIVGTHARLDALDAAGLIEFSAAGKPSLVRPKNIGGKQPQNWMDDIRRATGREAVGYATQKPVALLERIIASSSNEGDTVLDFCAGSGTTAVAARNLGRHSVSCDINVQSITAHRQRMPGANIVRMTAADAAAYIPDDGKKSVYSEASERMADGKEYADGGKTVRASAAKCAAMDIARELTLDDGCWICDFPRLPGHDGMMHLDHWHPASRGGSNDLRNRVVLCSTCNGAKGNRVVDWDAFRRERGNSRAMSRAQAEQIMQVVAARLGVRY